MNWEFRYVKVVKRVQILFIKRVNILAGSYPWDFYSVNVSLSPKKNVLSTHIEDPPSFGNTFNPIAIDAAVRFIYNQIINKPIYRYFKARSHGALGRASHTIHFQTDC